MYEQNPAKLVECISADQTAISGINCEKAAGSLEKVSPGEVPKDTQTVSGRSGYCPFSHFKTSAEMEFFLQNSTDNFEPDKLAHKICAKNAKLCKN